MNSPVEQFLAFADARLRRMAAEQEEFRRSAARMAAHLAGASPAAPQHDINERQLTTTED